MEHHESTYSSARDPLDHRVDAAIPSSAFYGSARQPVTSHVRAEYLSTSNFPPSQGLHENVNWKMDYDLSSFKHKNKSVDEMSTFGNSTPASTPPDLVSDTVESYVSNGHPLPADIPPSGAGKLVTNLLGIETDHPNGRKFLEPRLPNWIPDAWDFEVDEAQLAEMIDSSTSSAAALTSAPSSSSPGLASSKLALGPFKSTDLRLARPHPHAFFSPSTMAWIVSTPWPAGQSSIDCSNGLKAHHYINYTSYVDPRFVLRIGAAERSYYGEPTEAGWKDSRTDLFTAEIPTGLPCTDVLAKKDFWWPLLVCSYCSNAVVCSKPGDIPAVLHRELVKKFNDTRAQVSDDKENELLRIAEGWRMILQALRHLLWQNKFRTLSVAGNTFVNRIGWNDTVRDVFEAMGFIYGDNEGQGYLEAPSLDASTIQGRTNRATVLRAYLEVSIMALDYSKTLTNFSVNTVLTLKSPRSTLKSFFGGQPYQLASSIRKWPNDLVSKQSDAYQILGCTPMDPGNIICFAYESQCKFDGDRLALMKYFSCLTTVLDQRQSSDEISNLVGTERSNDRYTFADVYKSFAAVGFADKDDSQLNEISDESIMESFGVILSRVTENQEKSELKEALKIIANYKQSDLLVGILSSLQDSPEGPPLSLDEAFRILEIDRAVADDTFICAIYAIRIQDAPGMTTKAREALKVISEDRNSQYIRRFLDTGYAPAGEYDEQPVSPNRPVGLRNIGNTCFLNSLLQYYFAIKVFRDTILEQNSFTEEDPHDQRPVSKRVGGRLISPMEVLRSKRFLNLLQTLFNQLIQSQAPAVAPELELAKLALETSSQSQSLSITAPDASNSITTDKAVLPDDSVMITPEPPSVASPVETSSPQSVASILGQKRNSDHLNEDGTDGPAMDIDREEPRRNTLAEIDINRPSEAPTRQGTSDKSLSIPIKSSLDSMTSTARTRETADGVVEIVFDEDMTTQPNVPPALPPRCEEEKSTEIGDTNNGTKEGKDEFSEMVFGKQNDMPECMDQIFFKVDVALDPEKLSKSLRGATSLMQSLFTGKTQQKLGIPQTSVDITENAGTQEEIFNHLLIAVGGPERDLYDGLSSAFEDSKVEYGGQNVDRHVGITELPPILQIQLVVRICRLWMH